MVETGGDRVRGIKIAPGYHDYALDAPTVDALAEKLVAHNLALCVQMRMEDERSRHPAMRPRSVTAVAVAALAERHPDLRLLVCAAYMAELRTLAAPANIAVEMSMVESGRLLRDALAQMGALRLLA